MFTEVFADLPPAPAPLSAEEFRSRQDRLTSGLSTDTLLIVPSPPERVHSNDVHYRYRTSSDLLYLTGWEDPDATAYAVHKEGAWRWGLFVQPKDTLMEIWEGRRPGIEGALAQGIVDEAHSVQDVSSVLAPLIDSCKVVMLRRGVNNEVDALVDTHVLGRSRARQRHGTGPITIEDPSSRLAELRLRKTEAEVAWMRHASNISARAHVAAMRMPPSGLNERHLQAVIEGAFVYGGASGWAYPSIVGCGENATILHYTVNDSPCAEGDIVLIDAGAEVHGYASDITRSWPVGGRFNDAQREIYSIVLAAQEAAIAECKVGRPSDAPHAVARRVLAEGLIALGVIDQALEDALDLDHGQLAQWYMHGTGHWLGLDVHDVGVYSPGGTARPFESGMVITVEPGLYFGAWRPDVTCPERYANIGIRIEDDVLITDDGPVVLTADCPKTIEEIEAIMGS